MRRFVAALPHLLERKYWYMKHFRQLLNITVRAGLILYVSSAHTVVGDTLTRPPTPNIELLQELPIDTDRDEKKLDDKKPTYVSFDDINASLRGGENLQKGNWHGINGGTSPNDYVTDWWRVRIEPYGNHGISGKLLLDPDIKEAWASYEFQLGSNWTPSDGVKMPGFSSHINDGYLGAAGGNGGGWGGLCRSWSSRSGIVNPNGRSTAGKLSMYVYHRDSDNYYGSAKPENHPCLDTNNYPVDKNRRQFGETFNTKSYIVDNNWHTLTHHVKLNDIGQANGKVELYVDGELAASAVDLSFTDNSEFHNIAFWFQIYHGGSADSTGTVHDIYFNNFRWNAGPENYTLQ